MAAHDRRAAGARRTDSDEPDDTADPTGSGAQAGTDTGDAPAERDAHAAPAAGDAPAAPDGGETGDDSGYPDDDEWFPV